MIHEVRKARTAQSLAWGAVLLLALAHGAARAEMKPRPGDARAGREFAAHNCDSCHIIAPDQDLRPLIGGYAPGFADIANRPNTSADALRAFLSHPHGYSNMPYPDLAPADLSNVVAYIMSLRGRR